MIEKSKTDKNIASLGAFAQHALDSNKSEIGSYMYNGVKYIA